MRTRSKFPLWAAARSLVCGVAMVLASLAGVSPQPAAAAGSELSTEPIPLKSDEDLPPRTAPIIEIGPDFLGTGNIPEGIELPTGAVWTPSLWVIGDYRTSINYFDNGVDDPFLEWANRLDIFANLQLSGTERLLFGMSPLRDDTEFHGYIWEPDSNDGYQDTFSSTVIALFFEGEFGEIFPNLDPEDTGSLDYGFAVGRQPIFFQEGLMFNDNIDAVGITRDTVIIPGLSVDTRITGLFGWEEINRGDNVEDDDALLFGLFTETDFRKSTTNLDFAYVSSNDSGGGDGLFGGIGGVQRIGLWNTAFRANFSVSLDDEEPLALGQVTRPVDDGGLLFAEISKTLPYSEDVIYGNFFWGIEEYTSAARDELVGGPLGRLGILFASVGLGNYTAPLSNQAQNVAGGALGYQLFFNQARTQVVFELGGRVGTDEGVPTDGGIGTRFQQAIGNRVVFQIDAFGALQEDRDDGVGARGEILVRF